LRVEEGALDALERGTKLARLTQGRVLPPDLRAYCVALPLTPPEAVPSP